MLSDDSSGAVSARYVAVYPPPFVVGSRVSMSSIAPLRDVSACGRSLPVSVARSGAAVFKPSYTRR
jgi:hypothetical protein